MYHSRTWGGKSTRSSSHLFNVLLFLMNTIDSFLTISSSGTISPRPTVVIVMNTKYSASPRFHGSRHVKMIASRNMKEKRKERANQSGQFKSVSAAPLKVE